MSLTVGQATAWSMGSGIAEGRLGIRPSFLPTPADVFVILLHQNRTLTPGDSRGQSLWTEEFSQSGSVGTWEGIQMNNLSLKKAGKG